MRRLSLSVLVSLGFHAALVLGALGVSAWRGLSISRGVELVPITLEEIKELPLGPPPGGAADEAPDGTADQPPRPRRRARPRAPKAEGTLATSRPDGGAELKPDGGAPAAVAAEGVEVKKGDLRGWGPEGSRLTALLRLDRLRASPEAGTYIAAVDEMLRLLPDRRRLLDGSGLDLYRDFDALLIATPNPFDDTVTFLAARHHLTDAELRAALDRAASAAGREIEWREEGGRPVGVRRGGDDRIIVMPQPGLAVIAPPAYARLLLEHPPSPRGDAGAPDAGATPRRRMTWAELVARIDAEDGAMPEDGVFLMTATNLLRAAGDSALVVPGTRGAVDEDNGPRPAPAGMPKVLSLVAGTTPSTSLEIAAEFAAEAQAERWQSEWPSWRTKLLGNPLVLLAGLNPIVSRAELRRDGGTVVLRTTASSEETRRVLQMIVNFARTGGR